MGLIFFLIAAFMAGCASTQPNESGSETSGDIIRAAVVDEYAGAVTAKQNQEEFPAFKGLALLRQDGLYTGGESWSCLELTEGRFALVEENADVLIAEILDETAKNTQIILTRGKMWVSIPNPLRANESFEVLTPSLALGVRGTVFYVEADDASTLICALNGKVALQSQDADGNPLLDKSGKEVALEVERGVAVITVEDGLVTSAEQRELTSEEIAALYSKGESGPGGVYEFLRGRLDKLVWNEKKDVFGIIPQDGYGVYGYDRNTSGGYYYSNYHYRYEGNWKNGKPNGEGTLHVFYTFSSEYLNDPFFDSPTMYAPSLTYSCVTGTFVDGYAHGKVTETHHYTRGYTCTHEYELDMGRAMEDIEIFCSGRGLSLIYSPGILMAHHTVYPFTH